MKILFITNFYSGIQKSILNNEWNPQGMPAIYKLLERLKDQKIYFDNIFFSDKHLNLVLSKIVVRVFVFIFFFLNLLEKIFFA